MAIEIMQADLFVSFILAGLGLYCLLGKKNLIKMVIGIEILAKGATLCFVAVGGEAVQGYVIIAIAIEAIVTAIALSILVNVWRHTKSLDATKMMKLRG